MADIIHTGMFADGGVIGTNPSIIGGTWAVRWVENDVPLTEKSGVVAAGYHDGMGGSYACMPTVTNNLTEMLAVIRALQALPKSWTGIVYSDSAITLGRVFGGWKWTGIPAWMHQEYQRERLRLVNWSRIGYVNLQGHPTQSELATGIGKSGRPVSIHNVWADKECGKAGAAYLERMNPAVMA